jgi:chaperonin cofactor prefoldin
MSASTEAIDARVATLERQTEWLAVELERIRTVLLSMAEVTNEALLAEK